ncbi:MAG: FtsW/RodA/SpoVE family cell cycle protein [Armatimonadetes bacterium]|nr:FtsW/RodA/SpoVE family cell cycle protein [Armatimonadota bacterium]
MTRATTARRFSPGEPDISRGVDVYLLLAAGLLMFIGLAALYSIDYSRGTAWFPRQVVLFIVGLVPFLVLWLAPPKLWQRASAALYVLSIGLLGAVLVLGPTIGGARRWLLLGSLQFQPSEIAKITLAFALATFFVSRQDRIKRPSTFLLSLGLAALPALLVFRQPHLGGALTLVAIWLALTVVAGVPWRFVGIAVIAGLLMGTAAWMAPGILTTEQKSRVVGFLDPHPHRAGASYQQNSSKIAFGSGGAFGTGYLKGGLKEAGSVPEQQTDFVLSVIGEEGGLFGATLVLAAFMFFFYRCWLAGFRASSPFQRFAGAGILAALAFHFAANVGMNLMVLPVVGLWLPFLSYGGTALWLCMASVGFFAACK